MKWALVLAMMVAGGTAVTLFAADSSHAPAAPTQGESAVAPAATSEPAIAVQTDNSNAACLIDAAAVEDLRKRRDELEAKARDLAAKELEMAARERALEEELTKIENTREEIAKIEGLRKKEGQERVAKLVETIEGMSPKASAQLISTIDETLAVAAISQISTVKLSKIMNVMEPGCSSRLSELLAGVVRAKGKSSTSPNAAAPAAARFDVAEATNPGKGGELENGNLNINNSEKRASLAVPASQKQ